MNNEIRILFYMREVRLHFDIYLDRRRVEPRAQSVRIPLRRPGTPFSIHLALYHYVRQTRRADSLPTRLHISPVLSRWKSRVFHVIPKLWIRPTARTVVLLPTAPVNAGTRSSLSDISPTLARRTRRHGGYGGTTCPFPLRQDPTWAAKRSATLDGSFDLCHVDDPGGNGGVAPQGCPGSAFLTVERDRW